MDQVYMWYTALELLKANINIYQEEIKQTGSP
jgi:hypothetical protein